MIQNDMHAPVNDVQSTGSWAETSTPDQGFDWEFNGSKQASTWSPATEKLNG